MSNALLNGSMFYFCCVWCISGRDKIGNCYIQVFKKKGIKKQVKHEKSLRNKNLFDKKWQNMMDAHLALSYSCVIWITEFTTHGTTEAGIWRGKKCGRKSRICKSLCQYERLQLSWTKDDDNNIIRQTRTGCDDLISQTHIQYM